MTQEAIIAKLNALVDRIDGIDARVILLEQQFEAILNMRKDVEVIRKTVKHIEREVT